MNRLQPLEPKAQTGDRIRLISTPEDLDLIPVGVEGTVLRVHDHGDCGRRSKCPGGLMLTLPPDRVEAVRLASNEIVLLTLQHYLRLRIFAICRSESLTLLGSV